MSSSEEEEGEISPETRVSEYVFLNQNGDPISFAVLPLQWTQNDVILDNKTKVFLKGVADNGLLKIYKQVVAWKFDLSYALPEIYVLSKDEKWMTLQKPRKSFQSRIRTILITIHWLHFMKKNTEASAKSVWSHLQNVSSLYEFQPSEGDLLCHKQLIVDAVKRDKDFDKSENVLNFVKMPQTTIPPHQDVLMLKKDNFIDIGDGVVDEDEDEDYNVDADIDEEGGAGQTLFDPVCSICDDGGNVLFCEGRCLRSFHPTKAAGITSFCESLGFINDAQVDAIPSYLCNNCLYKQHQCYVCGELGSSNNSSGQEVFPCVSATCGHFYHPRCVAKLLHSDNEDEAEKLRVKIAAGDSFTCPTHKCFVCKQSEDPQVLDLQFALCRRCPRVYHRKCLPKNICFQSTIYYNIQRAWEGLLPCNRILMFCMKHKMITELGTPSRDHLIFPDPAVKEKKRKEELSYKGKNLASKRSNVSEVSATSRNLFKQPNLVQKICGDIHAGATSERTGIPCSRPEFSPLKKQNTCITSRKLLKQDASSDFDRSLAREKNKLIQRKDNLKVKLQSNETGFKTKNSNQNMHVMEKVASSRPLIDAEIERGVLTLVQDVDSSFNTKEFMKSQQQISGANSCSFRSVANKTITSGRVEASVKAVRAALEKLEAGASLEDAKTVCGPEVINQIFKWKENLAVYLGPFLHGMRYTSFGRHFTKVDKLKEIVDRLHWYVRDGDTIVDFCCGSNDFSGLLKKKLEEVGKSCLFKNYDIFPPKNDFNFEKRDWMSVKTNELPDGSRLIMGLNPPFGVRASLANKFINKALTFKPKLIILIVPSETRRLNEKEAYDLIWEDDRILSGKSFYLPGSVDAENKQLEQWNVKAPPLYLWSRRDWTAEHKAIAEQCRHVYCGPEEMNGNEDNAKVGFNYLMQEKHDCYTDFSRDVYACGGISSILDGVPEVNDGFEPEGSRGKHMEGPFPGSSSTWKNNDWTKQIHDNVTEMPHEVHGHMDALPKAAPDYGMALERDDFCIDMELSSPENRSEPPGHYEVPGTEGRGGVYKNRGKGPLNLGFKTNYGVRDNQTS